MHIQFKIIIFVPNSVNNCNFFLSLLFFINDMFSLETGYVLLPTIILPDSRPLTCYSFMPFMPSLQSLLKYLFPYACILWYVLVFCWFLFL
jgi:hypothetical protein